MSHDPQLVPGFQDPTLAATPAKKNNGMIWKTQVSAWKTGRPLSRLPHSSTPLSIVLTAMMVCPRTTPASETIRITSSARSRVAGVAAPTSSAVGKPRVIVMPSSVASPTAPLQRVPTRIG
ncbi:Uncharacterised protein [Mycobacteroides abscessus subsp. abscessus]|nr:Uncharacterised protein [Mycobacteroides abscessus subsp. abscessus]